MGHTAIDADHAHFLSLIAKTESQLEAWDGVGFARLMADVKLYLREHFAKEEDLFLLVRFAEAEQHIRLHRAIATQIDVICDSFAACESERKQQDAAKLFTLFLAEYFQQHVIKEDLKLHEALRSKLPQPPPANDYGYVLPPEFAHLTERMSFDIPKLPAPEGGFATFDQLCRAAIHRRIDRLLNFFHRRNPKIFRELPMPFFCSTLFAGKLYATIDALILPEILQARPIQLSGAGLNLPEYDSDSFWQHAPPPLLEAILTAWNNRWDALKLVAKDKPDGTTVQQVMPETKRLREMLQPDQPDDYDLPRIANREIKMLASLLDPGTDWRAKLDYTWEVAADIYEQEHDPRVFQERAREGALRDGLLAELEKLPVQWGDLIILLAHRVFPRVSTQFLEKFVANFGTTEKNREEFLPFTMQYLKKARDMPEIAYRERKEEEAHRQQAAALRDYLNGRANAVAKVKRPPIKDITKLSQTVLVADSSDHSRRLICQMLRSAGIAKVEEARDGYLALELLRAAPTSYGLIIADYGMTPGSGMHLLTVLRSDPNTPNACRQIPFVMTTFAADTGFKREVYGAGANAILTKPVAAKAVVTAALEALNN